MSQENPIQKEIQELNTLDEKRAEIEERIEKKIEPKLKQFLENNDFEGAKQFVGSCFRPLTLGPTGQGVLMFRRIILAENKHNGEKLNDPS